MTRLCCTTTCWLLPTGVGHETRVSKVSKACIGPAGDETSGHFDMNKSSPSEVTIGMDA